MKLSRNAYKRGYLEANASIQPLCAILAMWMIAFHHRLEIFLSK